MEPHAPRLWPLGYLLTFSPFGVWLPGDDRGWHHRGDGPAHRAPSRALAGWCAVRLHGRAMFFDEAQRALVATTFRHVCAHRAWSLHALAVQADHVHVVITAPATADAVTQYLKRWATNALRAHGLPQDQRVWAARGNARALVTVQGMQRAIRYVLDHPSVADAPP